MQVTREQIPLPLATELREILRCTACKAELREESDGYRCTACARLFPGVRGLVRFVEAQSYTESFGYQ